jgi:L-2,4-diaminobutyric acid acetyltransferase
MRDNEPFKNSSIFQSDQVQDQIAFRMPLVEDGSSVGAVIKACPPLDQNSLYCNLLQCTDFAETCVLAELDDEVVGWVSGYRPPNDLDTLFVWQVAVLEKVRGIKLGGSMIGELLGRTAMHGVTKSKTTITLDNQASWGVFRSMAKHLAAPFGSEVWFEQDKHLNGLHATEHLVTIGPFGTVTSR